MEQVKERKYLKLYEFGFGMVGVQSGIIKLSDKETHEEKYRFPFIDLSVLEDKKEIGEDLGFATESTDFVKLLFTNIEGLEVVQRALDFCRKELELHNQKTTE